MEKRWMRFGGERLARRAGLAVALVAVLLIAAAPTFASENTSSPSAAAAGDSGSVNIEATDKVLILGPTVTGGVNSKEALYAASLGYGVDVVDNTAWAAMTAPEFAAYRAIILGDPTCATGFAAAVANVAVWAPVVNGNVIVVGTDPVFHYVQGGQVLVEKSIAFAVGQAGKTGLQVGLSCSGATAGLPILNALSAGWTLQGAGCEDAIHVVATNPLLLGMTDADLSNWSCSVHEFATAWPSDFIPIALDTDAPPNFTSVDGFSGSPYVLGRGAGLTLGNISLAADGSQDVANDYKLTALVQEGGTAKSGVTVEFKCTMAEQPDVTGSAVTDAGGIAEFSYTRTVGGLDTCTASFVNSKSITETSNSVSVIWAGAIPIAPTFTG